MANINKHIPDYNSGYIDYIFNQDTDITKFDDKYITIYFPGNGNCIHQASKYTSSMNGVYSKHKLNLLINPLIDTNPYDAEVYNNNKTQLIHKIIMLILFPLYYLIFMLNGIYNITPYYTNIFKLNLAQCNDAYHYINIIERCIKEYPNKKLILYGCSKGASTIISVLYHIDKKYYNNIQLIVLEGVFDDVEIILKYRFGRLSNLVKFLLHNFTLYDDKYISPINMIPSIKINTPIVIISSQKDKIVPYTSSLNVYNKFIEYSNNRDLIHMITLKNSSHSNYVGDDPIDINNYYNDLISLYNKYL